MKYPQYLIPFLRNAPFPKVQPKSAKLRTDKGENLLSIKFANYMREKTWSNKCNCVWFHVSNESNKANDYAFANLQRNMGKFSGVADYIIMGDGLNLCLELKDGKKPLSETQKLFKQWCKDTKVYYEVAFSFEEAVDLLKKYKIITE